MKPQTPEVTAARIESAPRFYRGCFGEDARFAVVRGAQDVEQVLRYLPSNYALAESFEEAAPGSRRLIIIIGGRDDAGWTLDDYVIPRLASGLYWATEIN